MMNYNNLHLALTNSKNIIFAFDSHPLTQASPLEKSSYLTFLASLAIYTDGFSKEKLSFLQRLLKPLQLKEDLAFFLQAAKNINLKDVSTFLDCFKHQPLADNFLVDALLLLFCNRKPLAENFIYIAEFAELLEIPLLKMEQMLLLVQSIVQQDNNLYQQFLNTRTSIAEENFLYYSKNFVQGISVHNAAQLRVLGNFPLNTTTTYTSADVHFVQANLSFAENCKLIFEDATRVRFENCTFSNGRNLDLINCQQIEFNNCTFQNFSNRTLFIDTAQEVTLTNCHFENSTNNARSTIIAGTVYLKNCLKSQITACTFVNCQAKGLNSYTPSFGAAIYAQTVAPAEISIKNCQFTNCFSDTGSIVQISGYLGNISYDNLDFQNCNGELVLD